MAQPVQFVQPVEPVGQAATAAAAAALCNHYVREIQPEGTACPYCGTQVVALSAS